MELADHRAAFGIAQKGTPESDLLLCSAVPQDPMHYVEHVAAAGASLVTFHAEVLDCDTDRMKAVASAIRSAGMRCV